jgi:hypothetical protein
MIPDTTQESEMENAYRASVIALLAAILVAVVVQGNRLLRAMPYPQDIQDVSVVGSDANPLAVRIEPTESVSLQSQIERARIAKGVRGLENNSTPDGLSPEEQKRFDALYGTAGKPPSK